MPHQNLKVGAMKDISGEVNIAGGDIIKNIKTIYQRALTAAEEAARAREMESELLARGVAELAQNLSVQASEGVESGSPYKGLLSYNLNEAEIFCGRSAAKKALLNCIKQSSLTVLHAESGAGKSSLLQAGIAAQLIGNGHLAVYLRPHNADPIDFIKRVFLPELTQVPGLAQVSLREFLRQVCTVLGPKANLYLLLDQFEEFFKLLKKDERQPFLQSLADCLNDPSLRVRWVLSLRAESLSDLAELEAFGITPFKNPYRLNRLSRAEAEQAMIEPATRCGITFERTLIDHILDTLTTHDEIMPTHLQLVCSALTDDLPEAKTLTLVYYRDHEGGTEGILRDYLKRQLEHFPTAEQPLAWKVLRVLITADRQRAVKTHDEIYQELKTSSNASKKQVDTILGKLAERRLLFSLSVTAETFELAHDYLIQEIELDPQEQARKTAQELLDQEIRTYQRHKTLLTAERLAVIEPYQNELHLSTDAEILLSESKKAIQLEQRARLRRRNIVLVTSLSITVIMSLLAFWGFRNSQNEKQQAKIALARQLAAQAQSLFVAKNSREMTAILLAIQSMKMHPSAEPAFVLQNNNIAVPTVNMANGKSHDWVHSVAFSHDGKYAASGWDSSTLRIWEITTGMEISQMKHTSSVNSAAFSPNGKYIVSGSADGTARVWETATGTEVARVTHDGKFDEVTSVAFSSDGKYVVSGSWDRTVRVWDAATGREVARVTHEKEYAFVLSVAFSPDGKYIVSGSDDDTARVWNVSTGKEIARMTHEGKVTHVAFSPDGKYIVSGSEDNTARVWEANTGKEISRMIHPDTVDSVAFSSDGKYIISSGGDARLWEVRTGEQIFRVKHGIDYVNSAALSPNGKLIVSGSSDNTARVWEIATGEEIARIYHNDRVSSVAFSPDGRYVVSRGQDDHTLVWKIDTQDRIIDFSHDDSVTSVAFSPDSKYVVSGSYDRTARVWELGTGKETVQTHHNDIVSLVVFSPDGKYVVSGSGNTAHIWEVSTGEEISHMPFHWHLAFSPNGKYVVTDSGESIDVWDMTTKIVSIPYYGTLNARFSPDNKHLIAGNGSRVSIWEVTTGHEVRPVDQFHDPSVSSFDISPDCKYAVSGNQNNSIRVWEVATEREIASMMHDDEVFFVAFSPDSRYVVSTSIDNTVRVWDALTGKEISRMPQDFFAKLAVFSSDSKYIVTMANDNVVHVWDVNTGREVANLSHMDRVTSISFSPNGKYVVSGSLDKTIRVWMYRPDDLIEDACSRVTRNLTRAEWKQYIGSILPYQAVCSNLPTESELTTTP